MLHLYIYANSQCLAMRCELADQKCKLLWNINIQLISYEGPGTKYFQMGDPIPKPLHFLPWQSFPVWIHVVRWKRETSPTHLTLPAFVLPTNLPPTQWFFLSPSSSVLPQLGSLFPRLSTECWSSVRFSCSLMSTPQISLAQRKQPQPV